MMLLLLFLTGLLSDVFSPPWSAGYSMFLLEPLSHKVMHTSSLSKPSVLNIA